MANNLSDTSLETIKSVEDCMSLKSDELKSHLRRYKLPVGGKKNELAINVFILVCQLRAMESDCSTAKPSEGPNLKCEYVLANECRLMQWSNQYELLPPMTMTRLCMYLTRVPLEVVSKKKLKAFKYFVEGKVESFQVGVRKGFTYLYGTVQKSMSVKETYKCVIKFSEEHEIVYAACCCPAGLGLGNLGHCNHIGAILFANADYTKNHQDEEGASCTSKPSTWNVPKRSSKATPIDEAAFISVNLGTTPDDFIPKTNSYDPRAPCHRTLDTTRVRKLIETLNKVSPNNCFGFTYRNLYAPISDQPEAPEGEVLSTLDEPCKEFCEASCDDLAFDDSYDISSAEFHDVKDIYVDKIEMSKTGRD